MTIVDTIKAHNYLTALSSDRQLFWVRDTKELDGLTAAALVRPVVAVPERVAPAAGPHTRVAGRAAEGVVAGARDRLTLV